MKTNFNVIFEDDNYCGQVVVDSIISNTSSGGLRISDDIDIDEIKTLAREMTLKFSFIGLPRGGAKSGLRFSKSIIGEEKMKILECFGRRLAPIIRKGIYYPGMDMNCGPNELRALYRGAGIALGKLTDTSYFTAVSVANAIQICRETAVSTTKPMTIAIEGFGSVANYLAQRLPESKYRIIAVSTAKGAVSNKRGLPPEILSAYKNEFGDDFVGRLKDCKAVEKAEILMMPVDILVPSARTSSITRENVGDIKARFIVPAANAPYAEGTIGVLQEKGIICLPGFVVNSGGVYGSSLFDSGISVAVIEQISAIHFRKIVSSLLKKSMELQQSPVSVAKDIAMNRYRTKMEISDNGSLKDKVWNKLCEKGIVPKSVYSKIVSSKFIKNLQNLDVLITDWEK